MRPLIPFLLGAIAALALCAFGAAPVDSWAVIAAAGVLVALVAIVAAVPWNRIPRAWQAAPAVLGIALPSLLIAGDRSQGVSMFVMLAPAPAVWVALYHDDQRLAWVTNAVAAAAVFAADGSAGTALLLFVVVGGGIDLFRRLLSGERAAADDLRAVRDQQREIFDQLPDTAILVVDPTARIVSVEGGLFNGTDVSREDVLGKRIEDLVGADQMEPYRAALHAVLAGETMHLEHRGLTREAVYALEVMPLRDKHGTIIAAMCVARDITERKAAETRLHHLASHDDLTGLWNRRRFSEAVREQLSHTRRHGDEAALLLIDLDGFKGVNDQYGHAAGDRLLVAVADAIRGRLRESDHAGRFGGDEFAVLLNGVGATETATVADEFRLAIGAATIRFGGVEIRAGASVGAAAIDGTTVDEGALLAAADAAMYAEKSRLPG